MAGCRNRFAIDGDLRFAPVPPNPLRANRWPFRVKAYSGMKMSVSLRIT